MLEALSQAKELSAFATAITNDSTAQTRLRSKSQKTVFVPAHFVDGAGTSANPAAQTTAYTNLLLLHHVTLGRLTEEQLAAKDTISMLSDQRVQVKRTSSGGRSTIMLGSSAKITRSISCSDGMVYIIDHQLAPETKTLREALQADGRFTILLSILESPDAEDVLDLDWSYTLVAPTDTAFKAAFDRDRSLATRISRKTELTRFVKYSLLIGRLYPDELRERISKSLIRDSIDLQSMLGIPRPAKLSGDRIVINDSLVNPDAIESVDGLILVVDKLSLPEE